MDATNPPPVRGAGRPRLFDREAALAIALDRFWRQGFEGTSTTQLIAAMGISQPSLYAAFGSKEQLYREAVALYLKNYGRFLDDAFQSSSTAKDGMRNALLAAARQYSDGAHAPGCMVASAGLQVGDEHGPLFLHMAQLRAAGQEAIRVRLEQAKAEQELPAGTDAQALAAYFAMVIQGMAVQAKDGATTEVLQSMAQRAMMGWPVVSA